MSDLHHGPTPLASRSTASLFEAYRQAFYAVPASSPELREQAHRLRYELFCVENKIIDPAKNPDGLERDEYDNHSVQAVLVHRPTDRIAGTMRLILPPPNAERGCLPFHQFCKHPALRDPTFLPVQATGEFSRFAISKAFRRRLNDGIYGEPEDGARAGSSRRMIPHLSLGLMTVALQIGIENGVEFVCAAMEPALMRLLTACGIHFNRLGPMCEYHGLRQPCYARVVDLLEQLERERPDVWDVVTECGNLLPVPAAPEMPIHLPA